jgi:tRNA-dihydrouridine synthase 3
VSAPSPFLDAVVLAPLTVGGNLPFRRLCVELGADVTFGEMALVRKLLGGSPSEFALLKSHPDERFFGVQLADNKPDSLAEGARLAESRGARFVDLNCGCPIHEITRRGLGASLLRKPSRLGRLVAAMAKAVSVPVTVKLRVGWSEDEANVLQVARACEENGAAAISIHGRTREQRYSRAADWEMVGRVAAERGIPVIGNGDILTHYEARDRMSRHGVRSAMLARGALIKPWLFREIREGRTWLPTPEERFFVLWRFVELLREHFGTDERGQKRTMRFLPWHMNFFCRYVPLPEDPYEEQARVHPLLQSRLQAPPPESPLERLLADARPETHLRFSEELLASATRDEALSRAEALARALPDEPAAAELEVARSVIAG